MLGLTLLLAACGQSGALYIAGDDSDQGAEQIQGAADNPPATGTPSPGPSAGPTPAPSSAATQAPTPTPTPTPLAPPLTRPDSPPPAAP